MPIHRRFATTEELIELLARREPAVDWRLAVAALQAERVVTDILVKIEVYEEV